MASMQGSILKFGIRRLNFFGGEQVDPLVLRQRMDRQASRAPVHRQVQVQPADTASVPAEWLLPRVFTPGRALLYLHGGAWFMGSPASHRGFVSRLVNASGVPALSIDYRLAPEYPFPAGLEDCLSAYEWLQEAGIPAERIVVVGDSAGGNLTLALLVALQQAGRPLPAGAVAISPATDLVMTGESLVSRRASDPFFANIGMNTIISDYLGGNDPHNPLISPLYADLSGLPPLLIHVGTDEILLDDAVRFGERAQAAGVSAQTVVWPGMFHVFQMFSPFLPEARQAVEQITSFIRERVGEAG